MYKNNSALLLKLWLQNPRKIGAIVPSSPNLAKAMAQSLPKSPSGIILELGGGTGPVTRALLESGIDTDRLVVIERDFHLYQLLKEKYPKVKIIQGDVLHLTSLLKAQGIANVSGIVSSLPLLAMSKDIQMEIGRQCFAVLPKGAPFIQFTYGFFPPLPKIDSNIHVKREKSILLNVPPATIWTYRQSA